MNIHPTASVSPSARIGSRTRIWHWAQIADDAQIGEDCIVGSSVYIDRGVVIGSKVKIQTGAQFYRGAVVEDGVFIGPHAALTNDRYARAVTPDGQLKTDADWEQGSTLIRYGATIGAGAIVLANVTVGRFAMVAAGAVVVDDVPDHGLVSGIPGRLVGMVCACGHRLVDVLSSPTPYLECRHCGAGYARLAEGSTWTTQVLPAVFRAS